MEDMDRIRTALCRLAIGAQTKEVSEEYTATDDGLTLKSRKCVEKTLAPDLSAIKLLFSMNSLDSIESMTDEELNIEKEKLLKLLQEEQKT